MKKLLKIGVGLVALVMLLLLSIPLWFGFVAKTVANAVAPGVVKTDFHLGHIALNPYTARFELSDMQLANPAGYSEKYAVTVGDLAFDAETLSLMTDVIHIEEIKVKDIFVSVVSGGENNVGNFTQIQYNIAGGKEKYEAAQAEKAAKPESAEKPAESAEPTKKSEKKFIIDRIEISGLKLQLGFMPLPLPSLTLTDIGRKSGGCTMEETWNQICEAVMKSVGVVGDQLKSLGNLTGDSAGKAAAAVGEGAGKAVNAVGEGAKKAADALKKLW